MNLTDKMIKNINRQCLTAHKTKPGGSISMTENGDPLENAVAERVNGIIKEEYLQDHTVKNIS